MKCNVCMAVNNLDVGGLEKVVISLVNHLDQDWFRPFLICFDGPGKLIDQINLPEDQRLIMSRERAINFGVGRFDPLLLTRLRSFVQKNRIHIVHGHNTTPLIYGGIGVRLGLRRPLFVYSEHNQIYSATKSSRQRFPYYVRLADQIVAVSGDLERTLSQELRIRKPIQVIHNGIDGARYTFVADSNVRSELGIDPDDFLIGTGVVLSEQKGIPYLLEAAKTVLAQVDRARFVIAGDGPLRSKLEQMATDMGLGHRLRFVGYRSDMPEFISALDLYVLPSLWEGLPLALLEALAIGRPIVATRVGGNPEIVEDGVNGYIVPPRDSKALADAILSVVRDSDFVEATRRRNVERFNAKFSVEAMTRAHETLFRDLILSRVGLGSRSKD